MGKVTVTGDIKKASTEPIICVGRYSTTPVVTVEFRGRDAEKLGLVGVGRRIVFSFEETVNGKTLSEFCHSPTSEAIAELFDRAKKDHER